MSLIAQALKLAFAGSVDLRPLLAPCAHRLLVQVQLRRRESLEKCLYDLAIDGICRQVLADGELPLLSEIVAEVAGAALVLHDHLVAALSAVHEPVQECGS